MNTHGSLCMDRLRNNWYTVLRTSQPASKDPIPVPLGHLLQISQNPCYSHHFKCLTEGSRTSPSQSHTVHGIIKNKQKKQSKTNNLGGVINSQRLREELRNKELFHGCLSLLQGEGVTLFQGDPPCRHKELASQKQLGEDMGKREQNDCKLESLRSSY